MGNGTPPLRETAAALASTTAWPGNREHTTRNPVAIVRKLHSALSSSSSSASGEKLGFVVDMKFEAGRVALSNLHVAGPRVLGRVDHNASDPESHGER